MRWMGLIARFVVGGVWIAAGVLKLPDPAESIRAVRAYDLLPEGMVQFVGHSLPIFEIVIGLMLVAGLLTRWAAAFSAVLLVAFIIGISSAWARGLSIECGCFGGGGGPAVGASDKYPWEIARDIGLLALSALLIWRPRTPYSLDGILLPEIPAIEPSPAPEVRGAGSGTGSGTGKAARTRASQQAAEIRRAAAVKEQQRRQRMITPMVLVGVLAIVGVGYSIQSSRDTTGQSASAPAGVQDSYAVPFGEQAAPVVVDIYEDFMCPFCGQFEAASRSVLDESVGNGDVQIRYHPIAFLDRASTSRYSTRATNAFAVVLDTSGVEVAKKFHDLLFENQPAEGTAGLSDNQLIDFAVEAGADEGAVSAAIKDLKFEQWVKNATEASSKAGVNSTPTVQVDGVALEPSAIDDMVASLQAAIEAKIGTAQ